MMYVKDKFINIYNIIRINAYNYATLEREKKSISSLEDEITRIIFDNNNENEEKMAKHHGSRHRKLINSYNQRPRATKRIIRK